MKIKLSIIFIFVLTFTNINKANAYTRSDFIGKQPGIIIRISNITKFNSAIQASPIGKLWNSDEMEPFFNNQSLESLFQGIMRDSEKKQKFGDKTSKIIMEQIKLMKGEIIVGVSMMKKSELDNFSFLIEINPEDYKKYKDFEKKYMELNSDEKTVIIKTNFNDIPVYKYINSENKITWSSYLNGTMFLGNNREWIEKCLIKIEKEKPVVKIEVPSFSIKMTDNFIDEFLKIEKNKKNLKLFSTPKIIEALGIDGLKQMELRITLNKNNTELNIYIKNSAIRKGVWALLDRTPIPNSHRIIYVPDDIYSYSVSRIDIKSLWKQIPDIIKTISPRYYRQFDLTIRQFNKMFQFNISHDFFDNLGTLVTYYSRLEGEHNQNLYIWQLINSETIEKILEKLFSEISPLNMKFKNMLEIDSLNGTKLFSIKMKNNPLRDSINTPQKTSGFSFAIVRGDLIFGYSTLVRSYVINAFKNNKKNRFYESRLYKELLKTVPYNSVGYSISDTSKVIQTLINIIKNPVFMKSMYGNLLQNKNQKNKVDPLSNYIKNLKFNKLPNNKFITSFFGEIIGYYTITGENIVYKSIIKYPEK